MLSWDYGVEITRPVMASYLSAERGRTIDLTDSATLAELETYVPRDPVGQGREAIVVVRGTAPANPGRELGAPAGGLT
jgi:hypothetical protein